MQGGRKGDFGLTVLHLIGLFVQIHFAKPVNSNVVQDKTSYDAITILAAMTERWSIDLRSFTELNMEIRTRSELMRTNNDHGTKKGYIW